MYTLSKLNKLHEQTWVNLQKRLNEVQFSYRKLFPQPEVYEFIKNKAVSVGSWEGYFVPSLLTTTAYILACNHARVHARVQALTHNQPLNIYTIFVGYPGTGTFNAHYWTWKIVNFQQYLLHAERLNFSLWLLILFPYFFHRKSSAIQHASQDHLEQLDYTASIICKTMSSGLMKLLSTQKKGNHPLPGSFRYLE